MQSIRVRQGGFTLVEVLVVLVVLAILGTIAAGAYERALLKARNARAIAEIHEIAKALDAYAVDADRYPSDLGAVNCAFTDPWGHPYRYLRFYDPASTGTGGGSAPAGPGVPGPGNGNGGTRGGTGGAGTGTGAGNTLPAGLVALVRKDRFLVPLNTSYDLYSMGPDGKSKPPLTARESWDDIIRANDGGYIGLAADF